MNRASLNHIAMLWHKKIESHMMSKLNISKDNSQ